MLADALALKPYSLPVTPFALALAVPWIWVKKSLVAMIAMYSSAAGGVSMLVRVKGTPADAAARATLVRMSITAVAMQELSARD